MTEFIQVMTTAPTAADAERLAALLVERRLAACAQVLGPIVSRYWWEGQVERAEEWLLLAKTAAERYPAVEAAIRSEHPYRVPEILAVPVSAGLGDYLAWVRASLRGEPASQP